MKILHIIPSYYPSAKYGGPIPAVHLLNIQLIKKGLHVNVLSTNAGLEKRTDILIDKWLDYEGVGVKFFKYYGYEHYNFSPRLFRECAKVIKNYDIIKISASWNFPVMASCYYAIKYKIPYILIPHGSLMEYAVSMKSEIKKKINYNLFLKKYIHEASGIRLMSKYEKEMSRKYLNGATSAFVLPNGIDLTAFPKSKNDLIFKKYPQLANKRYIIFLGRINRIKGLDLLIRAFRELLTTYKDLYLVIAGPADDFSNNLNSYIMINNLKNNVVIPGNLSHDEKVSALQNADIFILPSYSENFGMVVVEAMACKVPVVISNKVGIYNEVIDYNAGLLVDTSVASITQGLTSLINNDKLKIEYTENATRLLNEHFNIVIVAEKMINIYREVINDK